MTENIAKPEKVKFSRSQLQAIRKANGTRASSKFTLSGLPRTRKLAPINLRLPKEER